MAYDSGKGEVFVANRNSNNVSVISDASDAVVATIPVGTAPSAVAYDSARGEVFVTNANSGNVSVISDASNKVVATIRVGSYPWDVAYDSGKGEVFVVNSGFGYGSGNVSVISDASNKVVATIPVGAEPKGVAYDSGKGEVFVTNEYSNNVSVISDASNTVVATIPVGSNPDGVAYDSGKGEVFVTNAISGNVSVISDASNTVVATIPVGYNLDGVAYDSGKGEVFVANAGLGNVIVISDASDAVVATITVGTAPSAVAYGSGKGEVFVANSGSDNVSVIPLNLSVAVTTANPSGPAWLNVSFTASAFAGSWNYTSWAWSFGDGNSSTLQNPTHTYMQPGTYRANVTVTDSSGAKATSNTVWINVTHPLPFSTTLTPSITTASVGQTVYVNVSMSGGVGPFSFKWNATPAYAGCVTSVTSSIATCTPSLPGKTFSLGVEVTDLYGATDNATAPTVSTSTPTVRIAPSRIAVDVNETVTFATSVTGDLASLSYAYTSPTMAGCALSTSATLTCIPKSNGTFAVSVTATDSYGNSWTATSVTIKVYPALLVNLTISSSTPLLAQTVAFTSNASGGNPPYNYTYLGLPHGCYSENKSSIGCLPTQSDWYNITVIVTDMNNGTAKATVSMHVIFDFNVVIPASSPVGKQLTIMVDTNETFNGSAINKSVLFSPGGGYGTLTYSYSGLPPGCTSADVSALTCTPTQAGKYSVTVSVHDQAGDHQTHTVLVNIVPFLGLPGYDGYLLIGAIVVAGVVGTTLLVLKKRRSSPPAWTEGANKDKELEKGEDGRETDETSPKPEKTAMGEGSKSNE